MKKLTVQQEFALKHSCVFEYNEIDKDSELIVTLKFKNTSEQIVVQVNEAGGVYFLETLWADQMRKIHDELTLVLHFIYMQVQAEIEEARQIDACNKSWQMGQESLRIREYAR